MSKRTLFLIFSLFVITFVLLLMAIYQPQTPKITQQITPTPDETIAQTILSFGSPIIATSSSSSYINYSLPVNISTGKNKVTAVQLEMQYDPTLLSNVKIATSDSFFIDPIILLNQIDIKTGRVTYAFGTKPTDQPVTGKGVVANLIFSVKNTVAEKTAIIFLPKTSITAVGINESALKETILSQLTFGIDNSTPSASPNQ